MGDTVVSLDDAADQATVVDLDTETGNVKVDYGDATTSYPSNFLRIVSKANEGGTTSAGAPGGDASGGAGTGTDETDVATVDATVDATAEVPGKYLRIKKGHAEAFKNVPLRAVWLKLNDEPAI